MSRSEIAGKTRQARRVTMLVVGMIGLCAAGASEREAEDKNASVLTTEWTRIESAIGSMSLEGTLRYTIPLETSRELKQLGLRLELEHTIDTDEHGQARSDWQVRGLQTYLVAAGREHLRWQPPAGATQQFERKKIGRSLAKAGSVNWLIRELAKGHFEIRSLDGRLWRYADGVLIAVEHPLLGQLRVSSQGAWITRIEQVAAPPGQPPLLEAGYSDAGRLLSLRMSDEKPWQFVWNDNGELIALIQPNGRELRWRYAAHLLNEINEPDRPPRLVRWETNAGYGRGDSRWPAPVHLAGFGEDEYRYELTSRGFILTRRDRASGDNTITVFNPRRLRLEQPESGQGFIVKFRNQTGGRGALERIETGDGTVLEEYFYDETGRLARVKKHDNSTMTFEYDDIGRLIAVDGGEAQ